MTGEEFPLTGLRTRIAPTPSGYLHFGNGINFSATWQLAQAYAGHVLLRIDDLDTARVRPEYIEDVFRTLEWLGIDWQEGPTGPEDFRRNWSQQLRTRDPSDLLERLRGKGLLYACDCSRSAIAGIAADGRYPGTCRALAKPLDDGHCAWRLNVKDVDAVEFNEMGEGRKHIDLQLLMGDPVLRTRGTAQSEPHASYQLASLADDLRFRINTIVRGEDLLASTACQLHIADLLGLAEFQAVAFVHHPLSLDAEGRKLSKSAGSASLKSWRESGRSPQVIHTAARGLLTARGLLSDAA